MSDVIYLLHFDRPEFARGIQHYIGRTVNLERRLEQHRKGEGARLTAVMAERGVGFTLVRTWTPENGETAHQLERRLKNRKRARDFCPACQTQSA